MTRIDFFNMVKLFPYILFDSYFFIIIVTMALLKEDTEKIALSENI